MKTLALVTALLASSAAFAQSDRTPQQPPRVQHIDIDDPDLVEGGLTGPDGVTVQSDNRADFSSLIRVRNSFHEKVLGSADEL